jgi:hypothetical protein
MDTRRVASRLEFDLSIFIAGMEQLLAAKPRPA